jgi:hypothetical protein
MSFDEQPDAPLHGECEAEIHRLEAQVKMLRDCIAYTESAYRLNVVKDDGPSSTLENMQRALAATEPDTENAKADSVVLAGSIETRVFTSGGGGAGATALTGGAGYGGGGFPWSVGASVGDGGRNGK